MWCWWWGWGGYCCWPCFGHNIWWWRWDCRRIYKWTSWWWRKSWRCIVMWCWWRGWGWHCYWPSCFGHNIWNILRSVCFFGIIWPLMTFSFWWFFNNFFHFWIMVNGSLVFPFNGAGTLSWYTRGHFEWETLHVSGHQTPYCLKSERQKKRSGAGDISKVTKFDSIGHLRRNWSWGIWGRAVDSVLWIGFM